MMTLPILAPQTRSEGGTPKFSTQELEHVQTDILKVSHNNTTNRKH